MNTPRSPRSPPPAASPGRVEGAPPSFASGDEGVHEAVSSGLPGGRTSGLDFVNDMAELAERARQTIPADEARRTLAAELVYRFVPGTSIFGVRVRRFIAGPKPDADRVDHARNEWGSDGFRSVLVSGGQEGEVVRHVAAAAACVLVGRVYLVRIASVYDWLQGFFRGRAEAKAEVAGNKAGIRVGRVLMKYMDGRMDSSHLRTAVGAILCD